MNGAITPKGRKPGDLRNLVEDYLTNGKYDPRKSQNKADNYKNARQTVEERRNVGNKKRTMVFERFAKLVSNLHVPTNEEHYHSLRRPPEQQRHDVEKHQRNLRVPSALMQTNKLKEDGRNNNSKMRRGKPSSYQTFRNRDASRGRSTSQSDQNTEVRITVSG